MICETARIWVADWPTCPCSISWLKLGHHLRDINGGRMNVSPNWLGQINLRDVEIARLKTGFLNATSLYKHILMFRQFLSTDHPFYHLFGVVESRSAQKVNDVFVQIDGFSVLRQDRDKQGGGIVHPCTSETIVKLAYCAHIQQRLPANRVSRSTWCARSNRANYLLSL